MPEGQGRLSVCATPIGNLGDVTLRVLDALRTADLIAAEDTRITRRLLARHGIETPLEPYHAHNLERRTPALVERIAAGAHIALVSDAGTPGVSDPGAHLVDACLAAGVAVEVLPGPSAIITALVASGLPTHAFYFGGFLPRKSGERRTRLQSLARLDATLVFYESPRRVAATLDAIAEVLPGRDAAMARELTKLHEEVARAPVAELAARLAGRELKGEVVLLVGPPPRGERATIDPDAVRARLHELQEAGMARSAAVKEVAADLGLPRNDVYRIALGTRETGEPPVTSA
jgi:16S rRNA (cytidine1402-2'-O)-methyltransferase